MKRLGRGVLGDVGDGLDLGVALHIGLADQDIDLQGLGDEGPREEGGQQEEGGFHASTLCPALPSATRMRQKGVRPSIDMQEYQLMA